MIPALARRWEWILIFALAAIRLWLTAARTVEAIGWAAYDDVWLLERARSIMDGQWLGDYSHLTLIKGAGYPLWIAFVSALGIPLLFAQQALYVLASLAVCRSVAPALPSSVARVFLFGVLLFNPMSFSDEIATRVTREGFYPALTLLLFAGVAGVLFRLEARPRVVLCWVMLSGLAIASFWHTREEGVWVVPLLGFALVALLHRVVSDSNVRWQRAVLILAIPIVMFAAVHGAIVVTNGLRYGVFEVVEFKEESFLRAYGSLTRVRQFPSRPRVPVPLEVRERVYAVSPAFAELRHFLEGPPGKTWATNSPPEARGDFGGSVFMWAFRDAVASAGYYDRGAAAVREYYGRLAREIEAARLEGRLDARPARASLLPPLLHGQMRAIFSTWMKGLLRVATFADVVVTPRSSRGSEAELRQYAELTHSRLAPRNVRIRSMHLVGWAVHVEGVLDITVEDSGGKRVPGAQVTRLPSPDLYEHLKNRWKEFEPARHARFDIRVPAMDGAFLVLSLRGRPIERIPLDEQSPHASEPNVRMVVDRFEVDADVPQLSALDSLDAFRLRVLAAIGRAYQLILMPLFALALLLYLPNVRSLSRSRGDWRMALLIAGLLSAILARVLILSMIDVTSFWVFTGGYQSPSHALLLVGCVLVAHEAVVALRTRRGGECASNAVQSPARVIPRADIFS